MMAPFHVAVCVHVAAADRPKYCAILKGHSLHGWLSLQREGLLLSSRVFELFRVEAEGRSWPEWAYLHLLRLPPGIHAREYLRRESEMDAGARSRFSDVDVSRWLATMSRRRRIEVLECEEEGYVPEPGRDAEQRRPEVYYWIEYIDVRQDALPEYRCSMTNSSYPAIHDLVRQGVFHSFMAFETREVMSQEPDMPAWNQIHICGLFGSRPAQSAMARFGEAVKEHSVEGKERIWERLAEIRTKPREDLCRELTDLRVDEPSACPRES